MDKSSDRNMAPDGFVILLRNGKHCIQTVTLELLNGLEIIADQNIWSIAFPNQKDGSVIQEKYSIGSCRPRNKKPESDIIGVYKIPGVTCVNVQELNLLISAAIRDCRI